MPTTAAPVRKTAYFDATLWSALRKRLFDSGQTYSEWAREMAEQYTAKPK